MLPITLTITAAGLDALVNAESGATDPIEITEVGLSATAVDPAPTIVALAGEFKRVGMVAGESAAPNIIHMTAQDPSVDVYDLRSIALYLADGTLFAVYGQADPLFTKVSIATFLLALDVNFSAEVDVAITFGDADFLYPPATEIEKGVAEIATQGEVDAEADDSRIVTPLKLGVRLAALLGTINAALAALVARTITGGGLATGGGDLSGNRVITVTAASLAETNAGAIGNKAVVPSGLATILANIAALFARTVTGAGLVTGGGDLTANRTLTVTKASGTESLARTLDDRAVTPLALAGLLPIATKSGGVLVFKIGDVIFQAGAGSIGANSNGSVTFPVGYTSECFFNCSGGDVGANIEGQVANSSNTLNGGSIVNSGASGSNYSWYAVGR